MTFASHLKQVCGLKSLQHPALAQYQLEGALLKRLVGQPQALYPLCRAVTYSVELVCECLKTTFELNQFKRLNT